MATTITSAGITFNDASVLTSANAVPSAVKLATARTINGVAFDGTGNITIPSSGTGASVAKAWINFDGYQPSQATKPYTRTGTTVTVTVTAHGLATGNTIIVSSATDSGLNGSAIITVTGVNTFTFTTASTGANGTLSYYLAINSSYNISSVSKTATGQFTIYFQTPMSDAEYCSVMGVGDPSNAWIMEQDGGVRSTTSYSFITLCGSFASCDKKSTNIAIFGN